MSGRRIAVVDLASERPIWRAPPPTHRAIRQAFGTSWTIRVVRAPTSSDGDGGAVSSASCRAAHDAEVYLGWGVPAAVVTATGGALRWAHSAAAGVGASITEEFRQCGAVLTNSPGVQAEPMADWAVTAIGCCLRGVLPAIEAQAQRRWAKDLFTDGSVPVREFGESHVGIVGLGGVGRAIATRCSALGMRVRGIRRHPDRRRPAGVESVRGPEALPELARWADVLLLATPLTGETTHIVGKTVLRRMRRDAFVVNLGRGGLIDEAALLAALDRGRLGGCILDVFAREPLPASHPFWRHPRVLVFPHVSSVSSGFWERETALIVDNIRRYLAGRPLRHVVDLDAGY